MVTTYETDISHWQRWQQEYQFGVLLIFPPDPPRGQVDEFRTKHDPRAQSFCGAHISLTVPLPRPLDHRHWGELEKIAVHIQPFSIQYGPLMNYLPHPGVCLAIDPQDELDRLRIALEATSCFDGAPARRHPFSAHMTLAEFISAEQTEALMVELEDVAPRGTFECTGVSYAVPDPSFHFTERKRLGLAAGQHRLQDAGGV